MFVEGMCAQAAVNTGDGFQEASKKNKRHPATGTGLLTQISRITYRQLPGTKKICNVDELKET